MTSPRHSRPGGSARKRLLFAGLLLAAAGTAGAAGPTAAELDWVQGSDHETEGGRRGLLCHGHYEQPAWLTDAGIDVSEDAPIEASALSADLAVEGDTRLTGEVIIRQGRTELRADHVELGESREQANLEGHVQIRVPDVLMIGDRGSTGLESRRSELSNASFVLHRFGVRGSAEQIRQDNEIIRITRGDFTRCEPGNDLWRIDGRSITLDYEEGFGVARNLFVRVKDTPIVYLPYIRFPIDDERHTGVLMPGFGYDSEAGADLSLPYYINLAPNYDLTYTPRVMWRRGFFHETQGRYLSERTRNQVNLGFLGADDLFREVDPATGRSSRGDRWYLNLQHQGQWTPRVSSSLDFSSVSDEDFLQDIGGEFDRQTAEAGDYSGRANRRSAALDQVAELRYTGGPLRLGMRFQGFQNLDAGAEDHYERVPQLLADYHTQLGSALFDFSTEATRFTKKHNLSQEGLRRIVGNRFAVDGQAQLPMRNRWGFLTGTALMKYRAYDLEDQPEALSSHPSVAVPGASIDTGVFFERSLQAWNRSMRQTLEPRLFLLWVDHRDQEDLPDFDSVRLTPTYNRLFREDRFAGRDRVGDAEQASLAVTSRLLNDATGHEYARLSVGQIHYFSDRRIGLASDPASLDPGEQRSALYSEGQIELDNGLRLDGSLQWNERDRESERGRLDLSWNPDERRILNLGYNFVAENQRHGNEGRNLEESDVSVLWPLAVKWNFIGRWNYDLDFDRTIETMVGVEYDDCCWRARLVYRRFLRDQRSLDLAEGFGTDPGNRAESGILFEFHFKGLGSLGHRLDSLLVESMRGYEPQEDF